MRRRHSLLLGLSLAALCLGGCGFSLRQTPHFAFSSLYVNAPTGINLANALKRILSADARVTLVADAKDMAQAQAILDIVQDQTDEVIAGKNASGEVVELTLRHRLRFKLRTPLGKELIPETELLLQRNLSFNTTAALAKEAEKAFLFRDMQSDVVQQLMRRLASVPSL